MSSFNTAVVCLLTETLSAGNHPGNVTLRPGEADLREQSVVNVSQMLTLDKRIYLVDPEK
jgi:mRNA interferase MazF